MFRLLLVALGGWVAWRYREHIKEYAKQRLPEVQTRAGEVLGEVTKQLKEGRQAAKDAAHPSTRQDKRGEQASA
jgi:hypothetical protein